MARVRLAALLITMAAAQTFMQRREIPVLKAPQDSCVKGSALRLIPRLFFDSEVSPRKASLMSKLQQNHWSCFIMLHH
jgi:hypothetical protein